MWKTKEQLKKEAGEMLFPIMERLDMQEILKQYDIVLTWEPEKNEALLGILETGAIKDLIASQDEI